MRSVAAAAAAVLSWTACAACAAGRATDRGADGGLAASAPPAATLVAPSQAPPEGRLTAHFYDVGQGLAVLVDLPGGQHVLVDTGDGPHRAGCGRRCEAADRHLVSRLREDLAGAPIDLVWITHPHSDHVGGAETVLAEFPVHAYVDNGLDAPRSEAGRARRAARERGALVAVVDPAHTEVPLVLYPRAPGVSLAAVVPPRWPSSCPRDANECSIGLRVDFGASSILFTGDAEHDEEGALDPGGPVTLLQVGHHGSDTSTSPAFLARVKPRYAVVSAGSPGEGLNRDYCHPRALVVRRLSRVLGGPTSSTLEAFDGDRCDRAQDSDWVAVPSSDALWATERDGDVVLTTTGDGTFRRVSAPVPASLATSRSGR